MKGGHMDHKTQEVVMGVRPNNHGEEENFAGSEEELTPVKRTKQQLAADILSNVQALHDLTKEYLADVDPDDQLPEQAEDISDLKESLWDYILLRTSRKQRQKKA
jgi:hypothetical protein